MSGQRVLDLGSGVGDVAMLAAGLVGSSGSVIGIERDARAINRARSRAAEAGLANVVFVQSDIDAYAPHTTFDAVVGRYVLQFLPDPVATLRSVTKHVRPAASSRFKKDPGFRFSLSQHICRSGLPALHCSMRPAFAPALI